MPRGLAASVHDPPSHHRQDRLDVLDLIRGDREVVAVHHDEIGQASCLDRAEVVLLKYEERVPSRVRDEGILAADRLSKHLGAADHLAGDSPPQRSEGQDLIRAAAIAAEPPHDTAFLNGVERRHVERRVSEDALIDAAVDDRPWVNGRVESQLPHAREMCRVELVHVRQHPAEILDGVVLVDCLDLVQEPADGVLEVRVHVQRQACLGDFRGDLPPQRELLRPRIRLAQEHRIVQRAVDALSKEDLIDVVVALKELHLPDAWQGTVDLLGGCAHADSVHAERADVELLLVGPSPIERKELGLASGDTERREPGAIQIPDHAERAGLDRGGRRFGDLPPRPAEAGFSDSAGRASLASRARSNRSAVPSRRCQVPAARGC